MANHSVTRLCNIWVKRYTYSLSVLSALSAALYPFAFSSSPSSYRTKCALSLVVVFHFSRLAFFFLPHKVCAVAFQALRDVYCLCERDRTYHVWVNVNLTNIKSVVITDYVVHIAWHRLTIMLIARNLSHSFDVTSKKKAHIVDSTYTQHRWARKIENKFASSRFHLFGSIRHAHATNNRTNWKHARRDWNISSWFGRCFFHSICFTIFDYNVSNTMNIDKFLPR